MEFDSLLKVIGGLFGAVALYFALALGLGSGGVVQLGSAIVSNAGDLPPEGERLKWGLSGARLHKAAAATIDGNVPLADVASRRSRSDTSVQPPILPLVASEGCQARPPQVGEAIANVYGASSPRDAAFSAVTRAKLEDAAQDWLIRSSADFSEPVPLPNFDRRHMLEGIDVYITETAAPIYVILQADNGRALFHLHLNDGVELAHVAVVSEDLVGVANVPTGVAVDWLGPACDVTVQRAPRPEWDFVQETLKGRGDEELLQATEATAAAYSDWFQSQFGVPSEDLITGYGTQSSVLVGPVPPEPMPYQAMTGVYLPADAVVLAGGYDARNAAYHAALHDILEEALGAPVETAMANSVMVPSLIGLRERAEALTPGATVEIVQTLPLVMFAPPGTFDIPTVGQDLFAAAMAPRMLREVECGLLLEELASACQMLGVEFKVLDGLQYRMTAQFGIELAAPVGDTPPGGRALDETRKVYQGVRPARDFADHHEVRRQSYGLMIEQCDVWREKYGNCSLKKVNFSFRPTADDPARLNARGDATYTVVMPAGG